jgi:hypothetical protein
LACTLATPLPWSRAKARVATGGVIRAVTTSLDDESSHNNNFNNKNLVEEKNLF